MGQVMKMVIGAIDSFMPGYKTYAVWVVAMGMMVCQMIGYHQFSQEVWGMVGITGMGTWKMSQDKKK